MEEQQPIIVTLKVTVPGLQAIIGALRKLPHEQIDDLVRELWAQGQQDIASQQAKAIADTEPEPVET